MLSSHISTRESTAQSHQNETLNLTYRFQPWARYNIPLIFSKQKINNWFMISVRLSSFRIQHIDTLPKYGQKTLDVSRST